MPFREGGLVDFNFEFQESLIGSRGNYVVHYISVTCACMQMETDKGMVGQADPTCLVCFGQGYVFRDPVRMSGLVTGLSNNRMWAQVGWIEPGDLSFSPSLKARRISDYDKIILTNSMSAEGQVLSRGSNTATIQRPSFLGENEDLLYWEAGRPTAIWIEDELGNKYHAGQYFLRGRTVVWTPGVIAKGVKYSIKYEAYPEFFCWVTPMERWDQNRELGQRVMLRKAVIDSNPSRREVRPPWKQEVLDGENSGVDDPYTDYGDGMTSLSEYLNRQG